MGTEAVRNQIRAELISQYEGRIKELEGAAEMKDKRIDWTVSDNAKKAIRIEDMQSKLDAVKHIINESSAWGDDLVEELEAAIGEQE